MCDSRSARPLLFEGGTGIFSGPTELALFDEDQQVTEWQPYDPDDNTSVLAPRDVVRPTLVLRRRGDQMKLLQMGTWMICPAGDSVSFPHPDTWTLQAM
jgi:hypothetical protein